MAVSLRASCDSIASLRVSCDSIASLDPGGGSTIFAKNSDRPARECQPLASYPAREHRAGQRLSCQYIEIDQTVHTWALSGSRPWWLWGLEHGVNERGVAIGNHTIFTRQAAADTGLTGMDLVRLGLERGATASEAAGVITALIERHGQGGSGYIDLVWPYNNSFVIADYNDVYLLEAAGRNWALKRGSGSVSTSNRVTITIDWESLSPRCQAQAEAMSGPFDFAAAYADTDAIPEVISSGRYRTTQAALAGNGPVTVRSAMRLMRDHYESGQHWRRRDDPDDERYYSLCMHADPVGTTTASMVTELGSAGPLSVRVALCNPCASVYMPLVVGAEPPAELLAGARDPEPGSAWWRFRSLADALETDPARLAPLLGDHWARVEESLEPLVADFAANGDPGSGGAFMEEAWRMVSEKLDEAARLVAA